MSDIAPQEYRVRDYHATTNALEAHLLITPVKTIGERMAWARKERSLTQVELAKRVGISQSAIGSYEAGHREKPRELLSIARALNVNPQWLESGEGEWDAPPQRWSSVFEEVLDERAAALGLNVHFVRRADAGTLPEWLNEGTHTGYTPDLELSKPRANPVYVEVKTKHAKERGLADRYVRLQEAHPNEYAVFFIDPDRDDLGLGEFLEGIVARMTPDEFDASTAARDDTPLFSRSPPRAAGGGEPVSGQGFGAKLSAMLGRPPKVAEPPAAYSTMQPIKAWEHEDELPEGEFIMVPRLEIHLSAGPGSNGSQVEIEFNEKQPQAFRAEWIRQQHLKPKKLAAMTARGNSMEPTIHDGDSLLVDTSQVDVVDGRVYGLWYEGGERVKRLYRMPGGGLRIRSDNMAEHPEIVLGPDYAGHVRIIGRVIHRSGTGGL